MARTPRSAQLPGGTTEPETTEAAAEAKPAPQEQAAPTAETGDDSAYREHARTLRAADVDATRLKRAVLTLDGWVCPATLTAPQVKQ